MNKGFSIVSVLVVLVIVGAGIIVFSPKDDTSMKESDVMMESKTEMKEDSMMKEEDTSMNTVMVAKGSYDTYSPEKLSETKGRIVLFFNASWCPTCISANKELKTASLPEGLTIFSVDYDSNSELKKKYGVTYQHTFVEVDVDGNLIKKWSGGGLAKIKTELGL